MEKQIALIGASCESEGHPTECVSTVSGSIQDADGHEDVTINGTPVADHGDSMSFDSHAHDYSGDPAECGDYYGHDLTPDESPALTINGKPVMRSGDGTTDPGSGGSAAITGTGGNNSVTHTN